MSKLRERVEFIHETVQSDALVEEYIDGRELYIGVMGNKRLTTFPVWEMQAIDNLAPVETVYLIPDDAICCCLCD